MKEFMNIEVIKLLDTSVIYLIFYSSQVIPMQVIPKKREMKVVLNEKNELIPIRIVIGWRV